MFEQEKVMSKEVILQAPIEVQLAISVINESTGQMGVATFSMPSGRYHDEASQRAQLAEFEKDHMPEGFRLMTKREWFNSKFGRCLDEVDESGTPQYIDFAMPGGNEWHP